MIKGDTRTIAHMMGTLRVAFFLGWIQTHVGRQHMMTFA